MVDEDSRDVASETAGGVPVNRDRRGGPEVIQGEVSSSGHGDAAPPQGATDEGATPAQSTQAASSGQSGPGALTALLSGALGGLVVAAIAAGAGYWLLAPKADLAEADASRVVAIESQAKREDAAIIDVEKRLAALEGNGSAQAIVAIGKRLDALQAANADDASRIASSAQVLSAEVKDLRADVDTARGEIPGLSARVAKLESIPPQTPAADLSAVMSRLDKIEAQLAAPKSESRVAPEKPAAADNPAAVAIVAAALRDRLVHGAPFPTEYAGLERLGVEPAKLAPLKAMVDGAPTDSALSAAFEAVRSKVLAAAAPTEEKGGTLDRFLAHLRGLVQVRNLNETAGDDAQALASRIEADCRRGDVSGALAAFAKLPEASRQAAAAWANAAESRQAADTALQSIRESAVAQLAQTGKL